MPVHISCMSLPDALVLQQRSAAAHHAVYSEPYTCCPAFLPPQLVFLLLSRLSRPFFNY